LIISEKGNAIETVNLDSRGAVVGTASLVANIPANVKRAVRARDPRQ